MSVFSLSATTFNHSHSYTPLNFFTSLQNFNGDSVCKLELKGRINRIFRVKVQVVSSHSNPKVLKRNRKSRYGEPVSPYDSGEDDEGEDEDEDEDEDEGDDDGGGGGDDVDGGDDDWISVDEFSDIGLSEADRERIKLKNSTEMKQGSFKHLERALGTSTLNSGSAHETRQHKLVIKNGKDNLKNQPKGVLNNTSRQSASIDSLGDSRKSKDILEKRVNGILSNSPRQSARIGSLGDRKKKEAESSSQNRYSHLSEEIDLDKRWYPLLDYLSTFGLKESEFIQIFERHMLSLQQNVDSAEERLRYLLSVGVKHRDIRKIISRQPQILGYSVENNLKPHVAFLRSLGIPESRIGQIIAATPSLFSYSIANSLRPTVKYLLEEIGIEKADLCKVVQLSPQILVQRIESTWNARYYFLTKELKAPRKSIVKMVTKHPQILHYSIEDGLLPRINFLRSIGMSNSDILKVLTSLTQVFSLSLEGNLKPKYKYLINELGNEVHSLAKYPMYLSLSLDQRIRPRHRFLVSLKKVPGGPFPLSSLVPTDESFCQQWAGTSLDKYLDFRERLLVKELANKYERK